MAQLSFQLHPHDTPSTRLPHNTAGHVQPQREPCSDRVHNHHIMGYPASTAWFQLACRGCGCSLGSSCMNPHLLLMATYESSSLYRVIYSFINLTGYILVTCAVRVAVFALPFRANSSDRQGLRIAIPTHSRQPVGLSSQPKEQD